MTSASSSRNRILVIGSGIGGLSSAIFLSKLGYDVTVVEKNPLPGGLMRSYVRKGIECPVGVHYMGALGNGQVLHSLFELMDVTEKIPVERMGAEGIIDQYIFDDFLFDLPEGIDAFEENLLTGFPDECEQIRSYLEMLKAASRHLQSLDFLFSDQGAFQLLDQLKPLGAILTEMHCSARLRSVLALPSSWIGVPLDRSPSIFHNMTLSSYLASAWRLLCSGAEMSDAFVASLKQLGGEILLGDRVDKILVESREVRGVQLMSGRAVTAPVVIAAIHPKKVFSLLPQKTVRPIYKNKILKLSDSHGITAVHAAVDASVHSPIPHNMFRIETGRNGIIEDTYFCQLRKSNQPGKNLLSVLTSGNSDLWQPWEETYTGMRDKEYLETKRMEAQRILGKAESIFGKIRDLELLDITTPLSFRDWVDSPGGSAYGVLRSSDQMQPLALLNRSLLKGLYFAGQSVLSPGILGTLLGSLTTVKSIIGPDLFKRSFSF